MVSAPRHRGDLTADISEDGLRSDGARTDAAPAENDTAPAGNSAAPAGNDPEPAGNSPEPAEIADLFYALCGRRRDVRGQFTGEPVDDAVLQRILGAAHAAPSVGLSQPWDFVLVRDPGTREAFREHVATERDTFARELSGEDAATFSKIKVEGILESTLSVVVTYDPDRGSPAVLGRHAIADAGLYSVCLAIQNLWLAATAEGLGVGWVSFYREPVLRALLNIPDRVRPVAWLCLGPVTHLERTPDLERHGWRSRLPLEAVVHTERYPDS